MLNINNTLLSGGFFAGGSEWNKIGSGLDHCFKIYYVLKGSAVILSDQGENIKLKEGVAYFINGFKIKKQFCPDLFEVNWLHFVCDSLLLKQSLQKLPVVVPVLNSLDKETEIIFNLFAHYFEKAPDLQNENLNKYISNSMKIQSLLINVIADVFERFSLNAELVDKKEGRLLPAIEYINGSYKSKIKLETLAGLCFVSENYFHTLFKKAFNCTPNYYILQLRMNEALNLLSNTSLQIKEIAREIGFYDVAYFSKTFSHFYDISPRQYRKTMASRIP